jgi:hypothetical protein
MEFTKNPLNTTIEFNGASIMNFKYNGVEIDSKCLADLEANPQTRIIVTLYLFT